MQAPGVLDSIDEVSDVTPGVVKFLVGLAVDFFGFQGLHKAFRPNVVIGVAQPVHAVGDAAGFKAVRYSRRRPGPAARRRAGGRAARPAVNSSPAGGPACGSDR